MFYFTPVRKHVLNKSLIYLFIYLSLNKLTFLKFLVSAVLFERAAILLSTSRVSRRVPNTFIFNLVI